MAVEAHKMSSQCDSRYKLLLDCLYDARDELRELMERFDNRLAREDISYSEKYVDGRLSVILYVQFLGAEPSIERSVGFDACGQLDREHPVLVFSVNRDRDNAENNDQ